MTGLRVERHGPASWAVISRPGRGNALGPEVAEGLAEWLAEAGADETVAALVVTGEGRAFCAGADVVASRALADRPAERRRFFDGVRGLLDSFGSAPVPVIAAVDGVAFAGGLELALACDLVVAGPGARFSDRHLVNGRIPAWGSSARLVAGLGPQGAAEMLYLPGDLTAEDLHRRGLVARVAGEGELHGAVQEIAEHLATCDRGALMAMKRVLVEQRRLLVDALVDVEARHFTDYLAGPQMASDPAGVPDASE